MRAVCAPQPDEEDEAVRKQGMSTSLSGASDRDVLLDALRGLALAWMTVYHFCFDLNHFGYIEQDFYRDPVWIWQRVAIVSLFLLTAGLSQVLAVERGQDWPRFRRRWYQIVMCAALVSLGSWWMFPGSWISFGVLHGIACMVLVLRYCLMRWRVTAGAALLWAFAMLVLTFVLTHLLQQRGGVLPQLLDSRWLNWTGVVSRKPVTEDYLPLLPWLAVMLLGVALARARPHSGLIPVSWAARSSLLRFLAFWGRWSLSYYMTHQLVLLGLLYLFGTLTAFP